MAKKNRHSWDPVEGSSKLKHAVCMWCQLQKWWDERLGKLIYMDKYGHLWHRTTSCTHETPNKRFKVPIYH